MDDELQDAVAELWALPYGDNAKALQSEIRERWPAVVMPNVGPQARFVACDCDIVVHGGARGPGKSWGLLLRMLRWVGIPGFTAMVLRREGTQIRKPGGLWSKAEEIYGRLRPAPTPRLSSMYMDWKWPNGAVVAFGHYQHEQDRGKYQGLEFAAIGIDEATHFTEDQFLFLLSCNRSTSGAPATMALTCNPDHDSFLFELVAPWEDPSHPLHGHVDYGEEVRIVRASDDEVPAAVAPYVREVRNGWAWVRSGCPFSKSLTYIPGRVHDNPILTSTNPGYVASLMQMSRLDRRRFLEGDWLARPTGGAYFSRGFFREVGNAPTCTQWLRSWDFAATARQASGGKKPDWTVGALVGVTADGHYHVADVRRMRGRPDEVRQFVRDTANTDGKDVAVLLQQTKGDAGAYQVHSFKADVLPDRTVRAVKLSGSKEDRAKPYSAAAEQGRVSVPAGAPWLQDFVLEHQAFPEGTYDDQVDAVSVAVEYLKPAPSQPAAGTPRPRRHQRRRR